MQEIYNSLHLLGYKIKELCNGFLIAQRPDGIECLFDNKGNVIKNNVSDIVTLSDALYIGTDTKTHTTILFDTKLNIMERLNKTDGKEIATIRNLVEIEDRVNGDLTIYEKDLKARFVITNEDKVQLKYTHVIKVIKHEGEFKLAVMDDEGNKIKLIDAEFNITELPIKIYNNYKEINDYYITKYLDKYEGGNLEVVDYEGHVIMSGRQVYIDTIHEDNDTIIAVTGYTISVYSASREINKSVDIYGRITNIKFTSNFDVIIVAYRNEQYLLNIITNEKSDSYNVIHPILTVMYHRNACRLNLDTLKADIKVKSVNTMRISEGIVEIIKGDEHKYYTPEFREILREF